MGYDDNFTRAKTKEQGGKERVVLNTEIYACLPGGELDAGMVIDARLPRLAGRKYQWRCGRMI